MGNQSEPRALRAVPNSLRCTSVDPEHEIRCFKPHNHKMNWHEALDPGKATIHTWIDPARSKSKAQHVKASGLL